MLIIFNVVIIISSIGFIFELHHVEFIRGRGMRMAALIKCPKCGSNRIEPVKQAGGLAGKMGVMVYVCLNCGKESKIKAKK